MYHWGNSEKKILTQIRLFQKEHELEQAKFALQNVLYVCCFIKRQTQLKFSSDEFCCRHPQAFIQSAGYWKTRGCGVHGEHWQKIWNSFNTLTVEAVVPTGCRSIDIRYEIYSVRTRCVVDTKKTKERSTQQAKRRRLDQLPQKRKQLPPPYRQQGGDPYSRSNRVWGPHHRAQSLLPRPPFLCLTRRRDAAW